MRSFQVVSGQNTLAQQFTNLRADAAGGGLLVHQQLGFFTLSTNPTNTKTLTLTINGTAVVITFVSSIGATPGNVLIGATAAATCANLLALLNQPQTTTANGVALSSANQTLLSYLSFALSGTTLTISSNNTLLYFPETSFSGSTTATSDSYTAQTMQLYVEPGVFYIAGTRVVFAGGSTPTVTAPSTHPRIDVLSINSTGTLSWTTGSENVSPTAPTYPSPATNMVLCEITNVVSEAQLLDFANQSASQGYISTDVRPDIQPSMNWGAFPTDLIPDGDGTRNLGSASFEWNNIYAKSGIFLNGSAFGTQLTLASVAAETISAGAAVAMGLYQSSNIGYDTSGDSTTTGGFNVTVGSNSNRVFVVQIIITNTVGNPSAPTATFNGVSITLAGTNLGQVTGSGNYYAMYQGTLVAPATGTNSLNIPAPGGANSILAIYYWSLYNCTQTSPQDNTSINSANGTSLSTTLTLNNHGAITLGAFYYGSTSGAIAGNVYNSNTASASNKAYGNSGATNLFAQNQTMTLSTTGASSAALIMGLVSIIPFNVAVLAFQNASSASANTRCSGFVGFAVASKTAGQAIIAQSAGVATGLSGLVVGTEYYLNDTQGTIGIAAGSVTRKVGVAVSPTQLLLTNIW